MYLRAPIACSTLLHLLVVYPKTGIAIGLISLVGIVGNSPLGSTNYAGLGSTLDRMEESINIKIPQNQIDQLVSTARLSDENIRYVLDACRCHDYEISQVRGDPKLMDSVTRLYIYDLLSRYNDPEAVRKMIASGKTP